MFRLITSLSRRVYAQVRDDLRADPYLVYVLLLAVVLAGFWFWHRVPNFATRDERWRVVDAMETIGFLLQDPSYDSLRKGVLYWRTYGATMYLYGLVCLPVFAYLFLTRQTEVFTATTRAWSDGLWIHWQSIPGWVWTGTLLLSRLTCVVFTVGCVYVIYRIGTVMQDRATGRLAALLLSLTWALLVSAHEVGEDVPALFFLLVTMYCALQYVETTRANWFCTGCLAGGLAIAFKLSAGVAVPILGVAYLACGRQPNVEWRDALFRPQLLVVGGVLGLLAVMVGFPSVILGGIDVLAERISRGTVAKGEPHGWIVAPTWWWLLRSSLNGVGLPLFVALIASVPAGLWRLRERSRAADGIAFALVGVAVYLYVYSGWSYVRMHHLLPVFALLILVLAPVAIRLIEHRPSVGRPLVALLLVTSALYAGIGVAGYADAPRDEATAWLAANADENATIESYVWDPQEAAVPHDATVFQPTDRQMTVDGETVNPNYVQWTQAMPERCPTYIQLGYHTSLLYLASDNHSARSASLSNNTMAEYYGALLTEDKYPYEVAKTFGPEPRFLRTNQPRDPTWKLLRVGIYPRTIQYGDPQDFGVNQYTVILERTGECQPEENSPL
ncbi:ArnT family glycosyltransferase [Haladaptatus sp. CMAA 1911]|uniref:ArnT family glycosyltransferase n=1 Tax=unclassified Haladaptatus TaxID=2622732 RepID=UPI003755226D